MAETLTTTPYAEQTVELSDEASEAHERYVDTRERLGSMAVKDAIGEEVRAVDRVATLLDARSDLKAWRKELAIDRQERFTVAAEQHGVIAEEAKAKVQFAKKGYDLGEKRKTAKAVAEVEVEDRRDARASIDRGLLARIGDRLQDRSVYKDTKKRIIEDMKLHEMRERSKLVDYKLDRYEAKMKQERAQKNAKRYGKPERGAWSKVRERADRIQVTGSRYKLRSNESVLEQLKRSAEKRKEMGDTKRAAAIRKSIKSRTPARKPARGRATTRP